MRLVVFASGHTSQSYKLAGEDKVAFLVRRSRHKGILSGEREIDDGVLGLRTAIKVSIRAIRCHHLCLPE